MTDPKDSYAGLPEGYVASPYPLDPASRSNCPCNRPDCGHPPTYSCHDCRLSFFWLSDRAVHINRLHYWPVTRNA